MTKTVKAGDPIREAITASWFNEINKNRRTGRELILPEPENPVRVRCFADTGIDLTRFDAANIVGPATPYEEFDGEALQYFTVSVKVNATLVADKWGILQGPCLPNQPSALTVLGVTWANFAYTSGHTHVDVVSGALTSGTSGKAIILSAPEDTGLPGLILIRGGTSSNVFVATMKENWGATTTKAANCDIFSFDGSTLTDTSTDAIVYDPLDAFDVLTSGASLYVTLQNGKYYAVNNAPCPV